MATPKTEKLPTTPETASSMSDQELDDALHAMLSANAEQATPETVEQLLGLNTSERNDQEINDMIAAAAEDALLDINISAAPADVLDPAGAETRRSDIEAMTIATRETIDKELEKTATGRIQSAAIHKAIYERNLPQLREAREAIVQELSETVPTSKDLEKPEDTHNREMLESFLKSIDKALNAG